MNWRNTIKAIAGNIVKPRKKPKAAPEVISTRLGVTILESTEKAIMDALAQELKAFDAELESYVEGIKAQNQTLLDQLDELHELEDRLLNAEKLHGEKY